ncbi:MAG: Ig-like domain-containing protein [Gallionellaceae bacterium]|nr:Ig-like domain-containing protein [Gallionellaceae bacterium]
MKSTHIKLRSCAKALLLAALPLAINQALAATQMLRADVVTVTMPDGVPVTMWGYAPDNNGCGTAGVTVPGPAIIVPPGDPALTVTLKNCLNVPTSLVIAGQLIADPTPVWTDGTSGARAGDLTRRVRSFTHETLAGGGVTDYVWNSLKPGTYLYETGTHPQVQVQMGLYGSLAKDDDVGNVAYSQGALDIIYNNQATLVYSEIDPALHAAVADGSYGSTGPTSTLEYHPKYFLINGQPYAATSGPIATVPAGQNMLLRFVNASLKSHVPTIEGQYWKMIAEDGNPYPFLGNPRQQYTAFLAPGKTMDVLLAPTNTGAANIRYPIYDSRHFDTNNGAQGGGMLAYLEVAPAGAAPPAAPLFDSAPVTTATAGVAYSYAAHATDPNGDTVSYSLNAPVQSGMTIAPTGLVSWTPAAAGSFPVSLRASDGTLFSDQAYTVAVASGAPANNPPTARNDSYTGIAHPASSGLTQVVAAPGVLANDTDPDGDALHTTAATSGRVSLAANGGFTLAPAGTGNGTTGTVAFSYQALDAANAASGTANVSITVIANRAPTAFSDALSVPRCTSCAAIPLNLVNNDTDLDTTTIDAANQLPLAVARIRSGTSGSGSTSGNISTRSRGTVTLSGGNVTYTPRRNFAGTDSFQYRVKDKLGKESGSTTSNTNNTGQGWATVTITVQ